MRASVILGISLAVLAAPATVFGPFDPRFPTFLVGVASATSEEDIAFPVDELGGCESKEACIAYCDEVENRAACIAFAKKHNIAYSSAQGDIPLPGPGACATELECITYCENPAHLRECLEFAKQHNLWPKSEIDDAEKVLPFLEAGTTPGGCQSEAACKAYCDAPEHFDACIAFAEQAGFITPEQAALVRQTGGKGPGGCTSEESCMAHCSSPERADECVDFAVQHGFIKPEEAEIARKFMAAGGSGPGNCRSAEACRSYCTEANFDECLRTFCDELEVMTKDQCDLMREAGTFGGPGGCDSEAECRAYCEAEEHWDACDEFISRFAAQDPNYPAACRDRGLGPNACRAFCESDPSVCGFGPGDYSGGFPQECKDKGLVDPDACRAYCEQDEDDRCGLMGGRVYIGELSGVPYTITPGLIDRDHDGARYADLITEQHPRAEDGYVLLLTRASAPIPAGDLAFTVDGAAVETFTDSLLTIPFSSPSSWENGMALFIDCPQDAELLLVSVRGAVVLRLADNHCEDQEIAGDVVDAATVIRPYDSDGDRVTDGIALTAFGSGSTAGWAILFDDVPQEHAFRDPERTAPLEIGGPWSIDQTIYVPCAPTTSTWVNATRGGNPWGAARVWCGGESDGGAGAGGADGGQGGFSGPGGCTDSQSCYAYCSEHYTDPECDQSGGGG